jgi:hypothetical protein
MSAHYAIYHRWACRFDREGLAPVRGSVRTCLGAVVTLNAVAACAPAPNRAPMTVEYYRSHVDVRATTLAQCGNDPGERADDADCINAREAARIEGVGSLKTLPPMGLPAENSSPR